MNIVFAVSLILTIVCGAILKSYKDKINGFMVVNNITLAFSVMALLLSAGHYIAILLNFLN